MLTTAFLEKSITLCRPACAGGEVAQYIPGLRDAPKEALGICVARENRPLLCAGDCGRPFTIQSISKPFALLLAILDRGAEEVFRHVGLEATGDAFNSVIKLETSETHKPFNAMINAGAIEVSSLIQGESPAHRFCRLLDFFRSVAENPDLTLNENVYESERGTGNRNWAMAYFLRGEGLLVGTPEDALDLYFRQCSIEVTAMDLARMGLFLARGGVRSDGERLVPEKYAQLVRSQIALCGLYDGSGEFAAKVGLPSKSGVGGGILSAHPGKRLGIGVYGPALDEKGNSIGGMALLERLAQKEGLSIF